MRVRLLFFLLLTGSGLYAQNLTGIWRGYFQSRELGSLVTDNYKYEIQIIQTNTSVKGVTYSYRGTDFYGKAAMSGTFTKATLRFLLQETKMIELRNTPGSDACIMTCYLKYERSGKEEFLEGNFTGINVRDSSDCGRGTVFLRRVPESDFYTEPFLLKNKPAASGRPDPRDLVKSPVKPGVPANAVKPPATTKPGPTVKAQPKKTPLPIITKKAVPQQPAVAQKTKADTIKRLAPVVIEAPVAVGPPRAVPVPQPKIKAPDVIARRENVLIRTIEVKTKEIVIKLYDNGVIDHDTVSVYQNNKLIISKEMLRAKPITYVITLNTTDNIQELIMVAENLGDIPPNTALMVVEAGGQKYEIHLTSTEQKNAMVRFIYKGE